MKESIYVSLDPYELAVIRKDKLTGTLRACLVKVKKRTEKYGAEYMGEFHVPHDRFHYFVSEALYMTRISETKQATDRANGKISESKKYGRKRG